MIEVHDKKQVSADRVLSFILAPNLSRVHIREFFQFDETGLNVRDVVRIEAMTTTLEG